MLDLSNNRLSKVRNKNKSNKISIFKKTNHDQVSCQIRQGAFAGLHSLDQLDLRHNSLERLGAEVFTGESESSIVMHDDGDDDDCS